jgi:hypothetical protein
VKLLGEIYAYIYNVKEQPLRKQFVQKLSSLLKKMESKETLVAGPQRSVFNHLKRQTFIKDQKIQHFKLRMNTFFVKIIKQFYLLVDDKYLKDFTKLNIEVKPILEDLHDVYQQLIDHTDLQ